MSQQEVKNSLTETASIIELFRPLNPVDQSALGLCEYSLKQALGAVMINFAYLEANQSVNDVGLRKIDPGLVGWLYRVSDPKHKGSMTQEEMLDGLELLAQNLETPEFATNIPTATRDVVDIATMPESAMRTKCRSKDLDTHYPKLHRRAQSALQAINKLTKNAWQALVDDEHLLHNQTASLVDRKSLNTVFSVRLRNESGLAGAFNPISALRAVAEQDWGNREDIKVKFIENLVAEFQQDSLLAVLPSDIPWVELTSSKAIDQSVYEEMSYLPRYVSIKNLAYDRRFYSDRHLWSLEAELSRIEIDFLRDFNFLAFGMDVIDPTEQEAAWGWSKRINIMYLVTDPTKETGCRPQYVSLLIDLNPPEPACYFDLMEQPSESRSTLILIQELIRSQWHEYHKLALRRKPISPINSPTFSRPKPQFTVMRPSKPARDIFIETPPSTTEIPEKKSWDIIPLEDQRIPDDDAAIAAAAIKKWKEYDFQRTSRFIKQYPGPGRLIRLKPNDRVRIFLLEQPDGRLKVTHVMRYKTDEQYNRYCANPVDHYPLKKKQ